MHYPNIEMLIERTKRYLDRDEKALKIIRENAQKWRATNFNVYVWPQTWGSTCTGFDITDDGEPAIGGSAMTEAYTTVIYIDVLDKYYVYIGDELCYIITEPSEKFIEDFKKMRLQGKRYAKENY